MDFSTIREKLLSDKYTILEQFEVCCLFLPLLILCLMFVCATGLCSDPVAKQMLAYARCSVLPYFLGHLIGYSAFC